MSFNHNYLPNEVEMRLEDFGPKQVRNYFCSALKSIFQGRLMHRPTITIHDETTMTIEIGHHSVRFTKMANGSWHYILDNDITQVRVFEPKDIFKAIEAALGVFLNQQFNLYLTFNYDCMG